MTVVSAPPGSGKTVLLRSWISQDGLEDCALGDLASQIPGALAADLARTPFLLIGTHEEMAAQLLRQAGELGIITSYVVREPRRLFDDRGA